jgi:hypothetical protein
MSVDKQPHTGAAEEAMLRAIGAGVLSKHDTTKAFENPRLVAQINKTQR